MNAAAVKLLIEDAQRAVATKILLHKAQTGQGNIFLTVNAQADQVDLPAFVKSEYPDQVTLAIDQRWANLQASDWGVAVRLWFTGLALDCAFPWSAVVMFYDTESKAGFLWGGEEAPAALPSPTVSKEARVLPFRGNLRLVKSEAEHGPIAS